MNENKIYLAFNLVFFIGNLVSYPVKKIFFFWGKDDRDEKWLNCVNLNLDFLINYNYY